MAKRKSKSKRARKHNLIINRRIRETRLERFFHLSEKKFIFLLGIWILLMIFHNFSYGLFGVQEPLIFLIAIVLLSIYLIKAIVYTLFHLKIHPKSAR